MRWRTATPLLAAAVAVVASACGGPTGEDGAGPSLLPSPLDRASPVGSPATDGTMAPTWPDGEQRFPDVLSAEVRPRGDGSFEVVATLSSPYDSAERYADAWRVLTPDGTVLGVRELLHDHANEQPFTRALTGVEIPPEVSRVSVQGRDSAYGFGGATATVEVPGR